MRHIQLIFRKVGKGNKWYQWVIALWTKILPQNWGTKGFYCHTEIRFVERGLCFSSAQAGTLKRLALKGPCSSAGSFIGVRFDDDRNVIKDPSQWDGFTVEMSDDEEQRLYDCCKELVGAPYDWLGVFFGFLTGFLQSRKRWYCSETCANRMNKAGSYLYKFWVISPLRWAKLSSEYFQTELMPLKGLMQ